MKIIKESMFTGMEHTLDLNITEEQLNRWENGELIQNVMPHLSAAEREFLISGVTDEEWQAIIIKENED